MKATPTLMTMIVIFSFSLLQQNVAQTDTSQLLLQDSLNARSLILSEVQLSPGEESWSYVELYNSGSASLDMSRYIIFDRGTWGTIPSLDGYESISKKRLSGTLEPGKTCLLAQWYENKALDPYSKAIYPNGYINHEAKRIADYEGVCCNASPDIPSMQVLNHSVGLLYVNQVKAYEDSVYPDSIFIDRFGLDYNDATANPNINSSPTITIAPMPLPAKVYVRKFSVSKGNTVDDQIPYGDLVLPMLTSGKIDFDNSEWIPLPQKQSKEFDKLFTTVDYHGPQADFELTSDSLSIDFTNKVISMPYGVSRDSVFRLLDTGPNHAWELQIGSDTGQFFVQEDDSLFFYTVGNKLETYRFSVNHIFYKDKFALLAPLVYKEKGVFKMRFSVSHGHLPMDTIGTLPYNMPVDTLFRYLIKPEWSTWQIIPVDGKPRPEVKDGDILKVTSANGMVIKRYRICVLPFIPNHNSKLETIYLPGSQLWENPNTYIYTDTMIDFHPDIYHYTVQLPADIRTSPPIVAVPEDDRANVLVNRAKNLFGTAEERTVTIVVTAEDDTSLSEYKILFNISDRSPYLTSSTYFIENDNAEPLQIYGVSSGTTFAQFLNKVNKIENGMTVKAFALDGSELSPDAPLIQGTNIWTWSADGFDSINYRINIGALSSDCKLTSTKYSVETNGATGTISGIQTGTSLKDLLSDLTAPEFSTVVVTDGGEQVIPMEKFNMDTIEIYFFKRMTSTIATENTFIEVTAQDHNSKCLYSLLFLDDEDPYVLSDVFSISQRYKIINFVNRTTPKSFLSNIIPSSGATVKLMNKYNEERTDGMMEYSDHLIVTKGNKRVKYYLDFTFTDSEWWWHIFYGINDKHKNKGYIYPNPSKDFIHLDGISGNTIEIYDLRGRLIYKHIVASEKPVIDIKSLKTGTYILKTKDAAFKMIKQSSN